jgi:hypothetical protein
LECASHRVPIAHKREAPTLDVFALLPRTERMRQLFGGAIVCDFPETYVDVSDIRDLPDSEEVHMEAETDSCLIVEILERQQDVPDASIAQFHFDNIAEENETEFSELKHTEEVPRPDQRFGKLFCGVGLQRGIVKFREKDRVGNDITLFVAVARIPDANADLIISLSAPESFSEAGSSFARGAKPNPQRALEVWRRVISSFSIIDYGLFA